MGFRDEILEEFRRLETDLFYTEKGHFAAGEQFNALHLFLGGTAAVAAAATTATVLKEYTVIAAVLGLVSAVAAAVLTFVKPQALAERHVSSGRRLGDLKFRVRQARELDGHAESGRSDAELRTMVGEFTAEKQALHDGAPTIGPLGFWRARQKIRAGHFEYDETP